MAGAEQLGEGSVADALRAEFPGLRLRTAAAPHASGRSPREVRDRLAALSDRFRGAQAVALRGEPVPSAYRVFFRHIGIDPDVHRVPVEEAAVQRLLRGGFASRGLLDDALTIALIETAVPVWAVDADRLQGGLALRPDGDARLVVADDAGAIAAVFDAPAAPHAPTRATRTVALYAIQVPGVPDLFAEEALCICLDLLERSA